MRPFILAVLCLSALCVGCGGSSSNNDTSTLAATCESASNALCNRASKCGLLSNLGFSSVAACVTAAENAAGCSTKVCAAGTTFDSSVASNCLTDIQNGACGSGEPGSCTSGYLCR
jgi:hypothetical protein